MQKSISKASLIPDQNKDRAKSPPAKTMVQHNKEEILKKKRLLREKHEAELCGNYELVYPIVSYKEEEAIKNRIYELKE